MPIGAMLRLVRIMQGSGAVRGTSRRDACLDGRRMQASFVWNSYKTPIFPLLPIFLLLLLKPHLLRDDSQFSSQDANPTLATPTEHVQMGMFTQLSAEINPLYRLSNHGIFKGLC